MKAGGNNAFSLVYTGISFLIVTLSFLPMLNATLTNGSWRGHGWGTYIYVNRIFEIAYSDIFYGGDKPTIRIYPLNRFAKPVDLVEFSAHESTVCGHNMFRDAVNVSIKKYNKNALKVDFTYPDVNLTQEVIVVDDEVIVRYRLSKPCGLTLTIWRWYYQSVMNISFADVEEDVRRLGSTSRIWFTFYEEKRNIKGWGVVEIDKPTEAYVMRDLNGINKVIIVTGNSSEIAFTVKGHLEGNIYSFSISDLNDSYTICYVYPVIASLTVILLYKPLRREWSTVVENG